MPTPAEVLVRRLERARQWPPPDDQRLFDLIKLWIALRDSDKGFIARHRGRDMADYMIDPLPEKISEAYQDLVAQGEPTVAPASEGDQDNMDRLVNENQLTTSWRHGIDQQVSEGSTWWRIYSDPEMAEAPLVGFHSRLGAAPLYVAGQLRAVAFWTRLDDGETSTAWRHLEVHEQGAVHNLLYRGTDRTLGRRMPLSLDAETDGLKDEWRHDLPMLAGWIPNKTGVDGVTPIGEFHSISDMLFELNESLDTGRKNRKLVARKRVVVPPSAVGPDGEVDVEKEAIVDERADTGDVSAGTSKFTVLEYSFDAEALITYMNDLAVKALSRVGIAAQFIGVPTADGFAQSGTALRLRLIPSVNAANGKAKPWDDQWPKILWLLAQVDALSLDLGGYGTTWADLSKPPAFTRKHALPEDPVERDARLSQARTAKIISLEQVVSERHPDWDRDQRDEEVKRLRADEQSAASSHPAGGLPNLFNGNAPSDRSGQGAAAAADGATAQGS